MFHCADMSIGIFVFPQVSLMFTGRQYSFHFSVEKQAARPLSPPPAGNWQHEGNFYAIIASEK